MIGFRFGRLVVQSENIERTKDRRIQYTCICDCGNVKVVSGRQLRKGTSSCGCLRLELITKSNPDYKHPLYARWLGMKQRCYNQNHHKYKDYGQRGIQVCQEWLNSFNQFVLDMPGFEPGLSLDRIDNDQGYSKLNCKWSTMKEQANNRRERDGRKMY